MVVRRIHPKSLISMKQLECDKQRQLERERLKSMLKDRAKIVENKNNAEGKETSRVLVLKDLQKWIKILHLFVTTRFM